ncbi:putative NBD/HSP70 family sugar kinase [Streptomyces aurantiacus]|uniref:ROK family protein n=1 Tax=Streptomyces aurantiacus TaxID=47760 RepID=UPI00278E01C4|nr:ROK family protein [Streptomyces aurantiacus]MDQ0772047.1 putative NBD/HSP70 family sugar kinase [Streptomyces aurantiacus]
MAHDHEGPLARLRRGHEELVLRQLRTHGPLSRGELGRLTGLSRTTLYDIVATLVDGGAVVAAAPAAAERRRGRPVETLSLHRDAGQAVGIDFARRAVHVAVVNVAHEVIGSASAPHGAGLPWEERVDLAGRLLGDLAGSTLRLGSLSGVGVGVVGPVHDTSTAEEPDSTGLSDSTELPDPTERADSSSAGASRRHHEDLPVLLRKRFGVPVLLDNNTRLAALAEATWGAAPGIQDVLYLRLSHGVGGGLVLGGALHRGSHGLSGEFGHITAEPGGRRCSCGKDGCLETVASIGAVLGAHPTAGDVDGFLAALPADPAARRVLDDVGTHVGTVLAAVCNTVGPHVVVLGGELAEAGPALFEPVERALSAHLMPVSRPGIDLRPATLGEVGGALGAIALVLHESPLLTRYRTPKSVE